MGFGELRMLQKYFGVSTSQLSLDQSAVLAGMLKGAETITRYSVGMRPIAAILSSKNMVAAGYIDENNESSLPISMASGSCL